MCISRHHATTATHYTCIRTTYYIAVVVHTTSIEQTLELHSTYIHTGAHSRALSHEQWSSPIFFPCFLVKSFVYNSLYSGYLACTSTCYALHGPWYTMCMVYLPTYLYGAWYLLASAATCMHATWWIPHDM